MRAVYMGTKGSKGTESYYTKNPGGTKKYIKSDEADMWVFKDEAEVLAALAAHETKMADIKASSPANEGEGESESEGEGEGEGEGESEGEGEGEATEAVDEVPVDEVAVEIEIQEDCAHCWIVMTQTMWPRIRLMLKRISMVLGISISGVLGYMWVCGSLAVITGLKPGRCFDP
eukprot:scaffold11363_cov94-Phaeocystis_antarctica.AAC.1